MTHAPPSGAATRQGPDIAEIFARYGDAARNTYSFGSEKLRALEDIIACRTSALGGHLNACDTCPHERPSYNSCRNRHCPKCQLTKQAQWLALRSARVLPVRHCHIVFTLPGRLRPFAQGKPEVYYNTLFDAASETLTVFGKKAKWLGGQLGITAILHTWTRDLNYHPHVHCVVTYGGLSKDGLTWLKPKQGDRYLFPQKALAFEFRRRFLTKIRRLHAAERAEDELAPDRCFEQLIHQLFQQKWNVYAKAPFGTPRHIFHYLGQYTHRVAISNQRIVSVTDEAVVFKTKEGKSKALKPTEFIRRFLNHVLPSGFVKIRHYGLYSPGNVKERLEVARKLLPPGPPEPVPTTVIDPKTGKLRAVDVRTLLTQLTGNDPSLCPICKQGIMRPIQVIARTRGPP